MTGLAAVLVACGVVLAGSVAHAQVVALGASNTEGYAAGGPSAAFPAKLEALLRAKGYNVRVANKGVFGDTTAGMLGRLDSAVPSGTKVVILGACEGFFNNKRRGVSEDQGRADVVAIKNRLQARGIRMILACRGPNMPKASDNIHMSPEAHVMLANELLPKVMGALGKR